MDPESLQALLRQHGLLDPPGHASPRFFGWAIGGGSLEGAIGAMATAFTQTNAFGGAQVATVVEEQVARWTAELLGLDGWAGVLTEGASSATLLGLAAARSAAYPELDRGLFGLPPGRVLTSDTAHHAVARASRILGLGEPVRIPTVNDAMDPEALATALARLEAERTRVVAVVATAGTAAAAAFDPLPAIAEWTRRAGTWLHVDGAFGAWARLSPRLAERVAGLEAADSVAVDHHKALHAPYGSGALLVRSEAPLADAVRAPSDYLLPLRGGYGGRDRWPGTRSLATSRRFGGLEVFTTIALRGKARLRSEVEASYARAERLAALVDLHPHLRRVAPVTGPAVLLRGPTDGRTHERAVTRLVQDGEAALSLVRRPDGLAVRASTLNPATTAADLEALVDRLARRVAG